VASDPQVNPRFGVNQYRQFGGHSSYNSFQIMVNKRMSQGMQVQGSYTWSKSLDNGDIFSFSSEGLNTVSLQNIYQPGLERGVSAFDARHNFTLNATYDVPTMQNGNMLARNVLGGWQLGGIMSLATGHPFTPILGFDNANIRTRARGDHLRPDIRPGAKANTTRAQDAAQYFDPTVFAIPEAGTLGNMARGSITGPGLANVDFTLKKKFSFSERRFIEFRSEFFNILNRANFRLPEEDQRTVAQRPSAANPTGVVATAGRLTALTTTPRQIQFSLRYEF
jgi:hypothetical protein